MRLHTYVVDLIEGRRRGALMKALLYAMSFCFRAALAVRNGAFDRGWVGVKSAPLPLVSVGNIVAGGAGKSAFVQMLARDLKKRGKVAILSRGYRGRVAQEGGLLYLNGAEALTPTLCGDEPYLLLRRLPGVELFVCKDRLRSARSALSKGASLAILDDGMQQRHLHKELEIVMLHSHDLYGRGFFLPRGYLRDSPKRLKGADLIAINHVRDAAHFEEVARDVARWSDAPMVGVRMVPKEVVTQRGGALLDLKGRRVGAFCGLGAPASFFATLKEMGCRVALEWALPDHVAPSARALAAFGERCLEKECSIMICSEKDWVKVEEYQMPALEWGYLRAEMEVVCGKAHYEALVERAASLMGGISR